MLVFSNAVGYIGLNEKSAQRKIPVDLHFLQHRHKGGGASPLGEACAACFEELAGVFASSGADAVAAIS